MFNLENAIKNWKRKLRRSPAFEDGDIAELDSHLREEIERLKAEGLTEEEAFQKAVEEFGEPESIGNELYKSRATQKAGPVPPWKQKSWVPSLLPNYIKIAWRNLRKNPGYSFINIFGLAVGLAACILIGLYVQNELSYDDFHEKGERIYRVGSSITTPNGSFLKGSGVGWPVGRTLETEYPAVKEVVYLRTYPRFSVKHNNRRFFEDMIYADDSFFEVFSFPLLDGHAETALERPYSLVLTREMAQKYFGNKRAVGKPLIMGDSLTFTVTAVVKVPKHSHIQFDILASFETICALYNGLCEENFSSEWFDLNVFNYVLLKKGASAKALQDEISDLVMKRSEGIEELGYTLKLQLEPLQQLYLNSVAAIHWVPTAISPIFIYCL